MKIINGLKYWGQLLLLPIYWLSFLFPRDKKIWLFGSTFGRRFADNPRYLYLYISQHKEELDLRPIWISHNKEIVEFLNQKGYEAYYYHSFKGILYAFRGKVYLFDNYSKDINFWQSGGAVKVNLWHGVGNKRINHDNLHDKVRHPKNLWEKFKYFPRRLSDEKPSHYILATSPVMCEIFARAFQVSREHVIEAGYPRNDYMLGTDIVNLFFPEEKSALDIVEAWKKDGGIVDLYMPTFRESEKQFVKMMDLQKFNAFLEKEQILFVTKLHPKSKLKAAFHEMKYSNILNLEADVDPYAFLKIADVLTTDYSSVYSDYMLLNRPVVAFQYDYAEYNRNTREAYFSFEEYMPEVNAETMEELMQRTKEVLADDVRREMRTVSRKKMFSKVGEKGCTKICDKIKELLK